MPQLGQTPCVAGLPFFMVMLLESFISFLERHLTQYACKERLCIIRMNLHFRSNMSKVEFSTEKELPLLDTAEGVINGLVSLRMHRMDY